MRPLLLCLIALAAGAVTAAAGPCAAVDDALAAERLRRSHVLNCDAEHRRILGLRLEVICAGDPSVSQMSAAAAAAHPSCLTREVVMEFDGLRDGYEGTCSTLARNQPEVHARVCVAQWGWLDPIVSRELAAARREAEERLATPEGLLEAERERVARAAVCAASGGHEPDGICARAWLSLRDAERRFDPRRLTAASRVAFDAVKADYDRHCALYRENADAQEWQQQSTRGLCSADWSFLTASRRRVGDGPARPESVELP
ncbi:MAG: hypothetical protein SF051_03320 [Elusimicrobiota bacterium]|nr:hypothetical protein [Elusimicrobiota bacterium]